MDPRRDAGEPGPAAGGDTPAGRALDDFLSLHAAGRWYDAHEALETVWRRSPERPMVLMQGLIQWVVALEHHRRGNPRGALALLDRSWRRLAGARPGELGLDWAPLQAAHADMRRAFAAWADGGPRPAVTAPPLRRLPGDPRPPAGPAG